MSVVDLAEARLLREVARRKPIGRLAVEWVYDDDGEPIVRLSFDYDEGEIGDPHTFLARYLPSLAAHLYSLASSSEGVEAGLAAGTNL